MKFSKKKFLSISVVLFILSSIAVFTGVFRLPFAGSDPNFITDRVFYICINIVFWTTGAFVLSAVIQKIMWSGILKISAGSKTIGRIEDFLTTFVYLAAFTAIFSVVFKQELTASLTVIFIAVWVFAAVIRRGLLGAFSASFFSSARPFKTEDRIRLINKNGNFSIIGEVIRFDGKAIHLKTEDDTLLIFSSMMLDDFIIENYSGIKKEIRNSINYKIDSSVPVDKAKRILSSSVKQVLLRLNPSDEQIPVVNIEKVDGSRIEYNVYYRIIPWENGAPDEVKDKILSDIIHNLKIAGIDSGARSILKKISLFELLDEDEIEKLSSTTHSEFYEKGRKIIQQGESGNSMYILAEGLLDVYIKTGNKETGDIRVGLITPGQFFGEMSLFTGEDRSATVSAVTDSIVYEITKDSIKKILEKNPKLAVEFGRIIAERQTINIKMLDDYNHRKDTLIEKIIGKIKSYFEL